MYSVMQDMEIRLSETMGLLNLISSVEKGDITGEKNINTPILKAAVILSLYNTVESTITQILISLHEKINASKVNYNNLNKNLKDLALVYFYKHKAKKGDIHNSLDVLHHTVNLIRGKGFFSLSYQDMSESYQLFSGNLDARSIRKVMNKYGIEVSETNGKSLKFIKDGRNTLAHGNKSFEEFGRDLMLSELRNYYCDAKSYLTEVLKESGSFIQEKKYKLSKPTAKSKICKRR